MASRRKPGWSTDAGQIVDRLFVYGTLRSGHPARSMLVDHVAASEPATSTGRIYHLSEGYPALIPEGDDVVVGELVTLRDLAAALPLIDAYEGEDFVRVLHTARTEAGEVVPAWCYVPVRRELVEGLEPIAGGDWLASVPPDP